MFLRVQKMCLSPAQVAVHPAPLPWWIGISKCLRYGEAAWGLTTTFLTRLYSLLLTCSIQETSTQCSNMALTGSDLATEWTTDRAESQATTATPANCLSLDKALLTIRSWAVTTRPC